MRAKSEYPTRHGDQHLPDGSDAVPKAMFMDHINLGVAGSTVITAAGTLVLAGNNMILNAGSGAGTITATASAVNYTVGGYNVTASTSIQLYAEGGSGHGVETKGNTIAKLTTAGNVFRVDDASGNPIMTLTG